MYQFFNYLNYIRVNGLLLADELRCKVARDIGLGMTILPPKFHWLPLDFGWSLADVLQKSREALTIEETPQLAIEAPIEEKKAPNVEKLDSEKEAKEKGKPWLEIGTWSNEMVMENDDDDCDSITDDMISDDLPSNLTMLSGGEMLTDGPAGEDWGTGIQSHTSKFRYGSPTIMPSQSSAQDGGFGTFNSYSDYNSDDDFSDLSDEVDYVVQQETGTQAVHPDGLRIEFKNDHVAEAFDDGPTFVMPDEVIAEPEDDFSWDWPDLGPDWKTIKSRYEQSVQDHQERILDGKGYLPLNEPILIERKVVDFGPENIHRHPEYKSQVVTLEQAFVQDSAMVIDATSGPVMQASIPDAGEIHDESTKNMSSKYFFLNIW